MKELYLLITELLSEIEELRWIDFDTGQLQEEQPSVAYPAALIDIDLTRCEDIDTNTQRVHAVFNVQLAFKAIGETNTKAPINQRDLALEYFDITEKVYQKLQGYRNGIFYPFSRVSVRNIQVRRGLKLVALQFSTAWNDHISS